MKEDVRMALLAENDTKEESRINFETACQPVRRRQAADDPAVVECCSRASARESGKWQ